MTSAAPHAVPMLEGNCVEHNVLFLLNSFEFLKRGHEKLGDAFEFYQGCDKLTAIRGTAATQHFYDADGRYVERQFGPATARDLLADNQRILVFLNGVQHRARKQWWLSVMSSKHTAALQPAVRLLARRQILEWKAASRAGETCRGCDVDPGSFDLMRRIVAELGVGGPDPKLGLAVFELGETCNLALDAVVQCPLRVHGVPLNEYARGTDARRECNRLLDGYVAALEKEPASSGGAAPSICRLAVDQLGDGAGFPGTRDEMIADLGFVLGAARGLYSDFYMALFRLATVHQDAVDLLRRDLADGSRVLLDRFCDELRRTAPILAQSNYGVVREPFEVGGCVLPAGSKVFVSLYDHHNRSPGSFVDASEFRPLVPRDTAGPPFVPMGGGEHLCLGQEFRKQVLATYVSEVLDQCSELRLAPTLCHPPPYKMDSVSHNHFIGGLYMFLR